MRKLSLIALVGLAGVALLGAACSQTGERSGAEQGSAQSSPAPQPQGAPPGAEAAPSSPAPPASSPDTAAPGAPAQGDGTAAAAAADAQATAPVADAVQGTAATPAAPPAPDEKAAAAPDPTVAASPIMASPATLTWTAPDSWREERPASPMRKGQYKIPGADGDPGDAQCVVYYFGPGQGGSAKNNADRWIAQFTQPDGTPSKDRARILFQSFGTAQAMLVEVKGTYNPQSMDGSPGTAALPGSMLIGAIVPGPDAPWFFKMTGPERTVEKNRGAFQELLKSVGSAGQ